MNFYIVLRDFESTLKKSHENQDEKIELSETATISMLE